MAVLMAPCSNCLRETKHKILSQWAAEDDFEDYMEEVSNDTYQIIQCAGCKMVSFRNSYLFMDDDELTVLHFPSPISRAKPKWVADLSFGMLGGKSDRHLGDLLTEIYAAISGGQHRLAGMGIRALIEQMMILKVGDRGSFAKTLDEFAKQGYLSLIQRDAIADILDAGHATMHRAYEPSESDLTTALDIVEGALAAVYVHGQAAKKVADKVPPRKQS